MELTSVTTPMTPSPPSQRKHRSKPKIVYEKHFQMTGPKMKALLKKIFWFHFSLVIGVVIIVHIGKYFANRLDGYRQGNIRRLASIFALEWGMVHLSVPIYLHLFSAFQKTPFMSAQYLFRAKQERVRLYCLIGFGLLLLLAHLTYLFYLIDSFEVFPFLYDLSAIANGIWIHLCILSYGFMAYNYTLQIISAFIYGRRLLNWLFSKLHFVKFISTYRKFQVGLTLIFTAVLSLTHWYASDKLMVRHKEIRIQRETLGTRQPIKVAVLTDLHAGAAIYAEQIASVVERVNQLDDLDAVFLIGDVIDAPRKLIEDRVESLRHLRSRLGTFYVTGNHEYYYGDVHEWFALFESYGIKILKNSVANLDGHCLVGLNDVFSDNSGIRNHIMDVHAIGECPRNETVIVLAHNPAATREILDYAKNSSHPVDLILSGHTHAGQYMVIVPFAYLLLPYLYGLYTLNAGATQLLVSAGTLFQNAPMKTPFMSEIWQLDIVPNAGV